MWTTTTFDYTQTSLDLKEDIFGSFGGILCWKNNLEQKKLLYK